MKLTAAICALALAASGCASLNSTSGPSAGAGTGPNPIPGPGTPKPSGSCHARGAGVYSLPDPSCTPGTLNKDVTQGTISKTICVRGWTKTIRPPYSVTGPEKKDVAKEYGITGSVHPYELDHFVPLELGGAANSYANYWDEPNYPNASGKLNPKDGLENVLKRRVCDDQMSLADAQKAIVTNWVDAYHKYVGGS